MVSVTKGVGTHPRGGGVSEKREKFLRPKLKAFRITAVLIVRGIGEVSRMTIFNVFVGLERGRFEICCFRSSDFNISGRAPPISGYLRKASPDLLYMLPPEQLVLG